MFIYPGDKDTVRSEQYDCACGRWDLVVKLQKHKCPHSTRYISICAIYRGEMMNKSSTMQDHKPLKQSDSCISCTNSKNNSHA